MDAEFVVGNNCLFRDGRHLSVAREDLVKFYGHHSIQICSSNAPDLTLCLWKASGLRSRPVEGGLIVAANILSNLPGAATAETSHVPAALRADTKFLIVYCSDNFCSTFGFTNHEHIVLRLCATVPGIERVYLGAATEDAFRWASMESFRTELKELISGRMLLCTVGFSLGAHVSCSSLDSRSSLWDQLTVASCIPVCQGRLTEATEIVVKCYTQQHSMSYRHVDSCKNSSSNHHDDVAKPAMVSDFAADISSGLTSSTLETCLSRLHNSVCTHELDVAVLTDIKRIKSLICLQQSQNVDEFSLVVFSRQCAARFGIMNGNVLELWCKLQSNPRSMAATQHKVLIACVDTTPSSSEIDGCMLSCALFNLHTVSSSSPTGHCEIQPCYVKVRVLWCRVCVHQLFF